MDGAGIAEASGEGVVTGGALALPLSLGLGLKGTLALAQTVSEDGTVCEGMGPPKAVPFGEGRGNAVATEPPALSVAVRALGDAVADTVTVARTATSVMHRASATLHTRPVAHAAGANSDTQPAEDAAIAGHSVETLGAPHNLGTSPPPAAALLCVRALVVPRASVAVNAAPRAHTATAAT